MSLSLITFCSPETNNGGKDSLTPGQGDTPTPSRPTTPRPADGTPRSGLLTIKVLQGRNLTLPPGSILPPAIESALASGIPRNSTSSNRESVQRRRHWWLPYVVLEFDKTQIMIDSLGGDLSTPVWMYRAFLYAPTRSLTASPFALTTLFFSFLVMCLEHPPLLSLPTSAHSLRSQGRTRLIWETTS